MSVVIPYLDTPACLAECLAALARESRDVDCEIIIVDNGSAVACKPSDAATVVLRNERNSGFAAACNQGAAKARGEVLLFLNSDAALVPGALAALVGALESSPELAAVAPLELRANGELVSPARRFLGAFGQALGLCGLPRGRPARSPLAIPQSDIGEVPWVSAGALLVRARAFHAVGGFDEGYFFYEEDEDLCWRFRRRGWRIGVSTKAVVHHDGGASTKSAGEWPALSLYAGQLRFVARRGGIAAAVAYRSSVGVAAAVKALAAARRSVDERRRQSLTPLMRLLWLRSTTASTKAA